jgi:anti-anti-sigma factor
MELNKKKIGDVTVIGINGRMDAITTSTYDSYMENIINDGEIKIVMDFGELDYISSAGLRSVLTTAKKLKTVNGMLAFANLSGMVNEVFEISGFASMFSIYNTEDEAIEKMK